MEKSPDAFRTISEVAEWLDVPTHVLRFWESRFSQVKPVKRAGGRRYYRPADMQLIGGIKRLLHDDGMTIRGVQKLLREEGVKHVSGFSQPLEHEMETVIELKASHPEPEPEPAAAPEPLPEEGPDTSEVASPPEPAPDEQPVLSFGSVRSTEPELPFAAAEPEAGLIDEEELSPAAPVSEHQPEAVQPQEPADPAEAVRAIPPTPGVPETDAADDETAHAAPPGYAARLIIRDRRAEQPEATMLATIIEALRQVRDRDSL